MNLLFMGEWGEALREMKDAIAVMDKNADHYWGQAMRLYQAWLHLHAMDFAGALAICDSALADYPSPRPHNIRTCLFLKGSAETALGNYERTSEYLLMAQAGMDRPAVIFDWYCRLRLESALTELWLAKGDLAPI